MEVLIGNIVAFVAASLMVYTGILNDRKKIIRIQTIYTCLFIISDFLLDGFSGAIINFLTIIRNLLSYYDRLGTLPKIIISVLAIITCRIFNNLGVIGMFPLFSMLMYILFMNTKDIQKFKLLIVVTSLLWGIYDLTIKLYVSFAFDIMTIIATIVTLFINEHKMKKNVKTE